MNSDALPGLDAYLTREPSPDAALAPFSPCGSSPCECADCYAPPPCDGCLLADATGDDGLCDECAMGRDLAAMQGAA